MDTSYKNQLPLVQVQDGEVDFFFNGRDDESEYDSQDSNAEDYAMNQYREGNLREMSESSDEPQDEETSETSEESQDEETSDASDESQDEETLKRHVGMLLGDDRV
ncbi:unnamed protein product [Microthlaspi erraticum]|uniref:Uncharacterized protein n=1 Tax=Microthlaspi erraticum TaxID=1685480 RepID=A0A6D2JK63_9BRAS|nr:unnamed protein product [Microthlaspi erraticum]